MKPSKTNHSQTLLFLPRISSFINPKNALKVLADKMDWDYFEKEFSNLYKDKKIGGHPPKPIRLMVSLLMLQHMHNLSDEKVVDYWLNNPYWQYFSGYDYMQWDAPIHPTSLIRFRNRIGEKGGQKILQATIREGLKQGAIKKKELKKVTVDTTVMEKNITYPTDSKLLNKARINLVKSAKKNNIVLRQNYNKLGKKENMKAARYAHAKQFKRMGKSVKKLKTFLRRVKEDIKRKLTAELRGIFQDQLTIAEKLLKQTKLSKNKIYSIHETDVYCVAKGKPRTPYEYGCKVSIVTTQKKGFVLSAQALPTNKYDGHTLASALNNAEEITNQKLNEVLVDKGYRNHGIKDKTVYISGQKKGLSSYMQRKIKRRSGIEACISEMKHSGKMRRNYLKGQIGDTVNALLCGVGQNMRRLVAHMHVLWLFFIYFFAMYNSHMILTEIG